MAAIHELLKQVADPALRARLAEEFDRATQNKKFGLVFEEHLPECTPLYGVPVRRGGTVARKSQKISDNYSVVKISDGTAVCRNKADGMTEEIPVDELVAVAEFGDPIFPYLEPIDKVENAPDSDLWHTLIEADNYHALQLLEYLYPHKVDCIYIDPPYNTGARDWKYNNDYVDGSDAYRHSKWLSFMQKRLKIAKRLLNPEGSVLIVTIDEKEYLHLGCLLEDVFPEAKIQMISTVINPKGTARTNEFSRVNEFIFFVMIGEYEICRTGNDMLTQDVSQDTSVRWRGFPRTGRKGLRPVNPGSWYPIYFNSSDDSFHSIGDTVYEGDDIPAAPEGTYAIWPPIRNGEEYSWAMVPSTFRRLYEIGAIKFGKPSKGKGAPISYLTNNQLEQIKNGIIIVTGKDANGSLEVEYAMDSKTTAPKTQWNLTAHEAGAYGTNIIGSIIPGRRFAFPKSLYAVEDTLRFFVKNNPDALIVDFFAGSGTTLHAVNLLNAEDDGHRRCIMVTNNEVSETEEATLTAQGFHPGDPEWEQQGIARNVTWPRTVCSIEGNDINGNPLPGNYGVDVEKYFPDTEKRGRYIKKKVPAYPALASMSMSDGFAANAEFFKLGFLDKDRVSLGRQFHEILPLLWLKSGAMGKRPELDGDDEPLMLVLPQNHFAILVEEAAYSSFAKKVAQYDNIDTIYFVTNSESAYQEMSADIGCENTYQLYRDYLDNFVIGARRDRA